VGILASTKDEKRKDIEEEEEENMQKQEGVEQR
jgi:hypothetical protein